MGLMLVGYTLLIAFGRRGGVVFFSLFFVYFAAPLSHFVVFVVVLWCGFAISAHVSSPLPQVVPLGDLPVIVFMFVLLSRCAPHFVCVGVVRGMLQSSAFSEGTYVESCASVLDFMWRGGRVGVGASLVHAYDTSDPPPTPTPTPFQFNHNLYVYTPFLQKTLKLGPVCCVGAHVCGDGAALALQGRCARSAVTMQ